MLNDWRIQSWALEKMEVRNAAGLVKVVTFLTLKDNDLYSTEASPLINLKAKSSNWASC